MMKHPAPFRDRQILPDTLTAGGDIIRTPVRAAMAQAALREYRVIGGLPAEQQLIIDADSRTVETQPGTKFRTPSNALIIV